MIQSVVIYNRLTNVATFGSFKTWQQHFLFIENY
jgi:hypothetical protein